MNNTLLILCLPLLLAGCTPTRNGSQPRVDIDPGGSAISRGTGAEVLRAANAFLATLSSTQRSSVLLPYTQANAVTWSNLPVGVAPHNGVQLGTLSSTQLAAALVVVRAATGTAQAQGFDQQMQIRAADDVLKVEGQGKTGPSSFSSGNYFLAFLGAPSAAGQWQLQFGGHHLALNVTYNKGSVTGATPMFEGVEPKCWSVSGTTTTADTCTAPGTSGSTTTYAPLYQEQQAMAAMLAGLSPTQRSSARLSQTFTEVLLGPDQDSAFPLTKQGLAVSSLSSAQKTLVLAAIKPWVQDVDDLTAAALLEIYEGELDRTTLAYSGDPSLTSNADYVRIDGPSVWIEFVCQRGRVYASQIHYHTVWRDHTRDYGASFSF